MTQSSYVKIFDNTLRDGEQSPAATMTSAEKLEVARSLARLGVDMIEAGFPVASPDDLEGVRRIAQEVGQPPRGTLAARRPHDCRGLQPGLHPARVLPDAGRDPEE